MLQLRDWSHCPYCGQEWDWGKREVGASDDVAVCGGCGVEWYDHEKIRRQAFAEAVEKLDHFERRHTFSDGVLLSMREWLEVQVTGVDKAKGE